MKQDHMKRGVLAFVFTFVMAASGVAMAGVLATAGTPSAGPRAGDQTTEPNDQGGVHGGPIDRFQRPVSCDLTHVSSLPGNWTHGDYVSAVAGGGTPSDIQEAAHSDCGKPMVAVGHGGPPANALKHIAAGQARAQSSTSP